MKMCTHIFKCDYYKHRSIVYSKLYVNISIITSYINVNILY